MLVCFCFVLFFSGKQEANWPHFTVLLVCRSSPYKLNGRNGVSCICGFPILRTSSWVSERVSEEWVNERVSGEQVTELHVYSATRLHNGPAKQFFLSSVFCWFASLGLLNGVPNTLSWPWTHCKAGDNHRFLTLMPQFLRHASPHLAFQLFGWCGNGGLRNKWLAQAHTGYSHNLEVPTAETGHAFTKTLSGENFWILLCIPHMKFDMSCCLEMMTWPVRKMSWFILVLKADPWKTWN